MVFLPAGRDTYKLKVPTSRMDGNRRVTVKRTTNTKDKKLALAMAGVVDELADKHRAWDVLDRIDARTLSVPALWDLWHRAGKHLPTLRGLLDDVKLMPLLETWATSLRSARRDITEDTAQHYEHAVRQFVTDGMLRSGYTTRALTVHLDSLDNEPGTVRKKGVALGQFGQWLVANGYAERDPMDGVELPAQGAPRDLWLTTPQVVTLADAKAGEYRTLDYLLAGSGADLTTGLGITRDCIDLTTWRVRLRGTKSKNRDRFVTLAGFAREAIRDRCRTMMPHARLFDAIPHRWAAADHHAETRERLVTAHPWVDGYWLRDHRHTWGVRLAKAGAPLQVIADGLGNTLAMVAKVYTKYQPTDGERQHWERIAAEQDAVEMKAG